MHPCAGRACGKQGRLEDRNLKRRIGREGIVEGRSSPLANGVWSERIWGGGTHGGRFVYVSRKGRVREWVQGKKAETPIENTDVEDRPALSTIQLGRAKGGVANGERELEEEYWKELEKGDGKIPERRSKGGVEKVWKKKEP